jgi:uncharacterized protein (TIGR03086 family)
MQFNLNITKGKRGIMELGVETEAAATLEKAYDRLTELVHDLGPADLGKATPCAELDVRGVLSHTLAAAQMFTDVKEGHPVGDRLGDLLGQADPASALDRVRRANTAAWAAPGAKQGETVLPFGTFPSAAAYLINLGEIAVHGWDIAVGTGRQATIDEELAIAVLGFYERAPMERLRGRGAFGPAVEVPPGSSAQDRLLGLLGRQPR